MKKIPTKLTNEMMVRDLLRDSDFGPLGQVFIIEAIRHYANMVASRPEPEDDEESIINPKVWHAIAKDVSRRIKANNDL